MGGKTVRANVDEVRSPRRVLRWHSRFTPRGDLGKTPRSRRRAIWGLLTLVALTAVVSIVRAVRRAEPGEPGVVYRAEVGALPDPRGQMIALSDGRDTRAVVLFFLGVECPVSNGYAPVMRQLAETYAPRGVAFRGIHADPDVDATSAARHKEEYALNFPVLLDASRDLTDQVGVRSTPEAVVLDPGGRVVYRGRIDDRHTEEGRRRQVAGSHDLQDALDAVLSGRAPAVAETRAFGCPLPRLRTASAGEEITYNRHVAPILARRCVGCHRPGEVAPFPLVSYRDAAKRADFLRDVTESRRMPPWKPRHGFGEFLDEARLSPRELAILAEWAEAGAPEGEASDSPPPPVLPSSGWQLGEPDLVLAIPEPFAIGAGQDVYRAFVMPIPLEHAQGIAAVEFRPDNRRVVHHARVYVDPTPDCRRRDLADAAPGFATFGGNDIPKPNLGIWTPGMIARLPPPGTGTILKPGSDLVLLMHYHGTGKPEADRSRVGLYFAKDPITRPMTSIPMSTAKIDIPPGASRHRITLDATLPADSHAYSVLPHGHYLLRDIKMWATLPDGTVRRLLWIDDWDFNWQGIYHFAEPLALPGGTKLHVSATYDNSDANPLNPNRPPKRVRFGPSSTAEMLGCHLQVLPDRPEDDRVFRKKWPHSL